MRMQPRLMLPSLCRFPLAVLAALHVGGGIAYGASLGDIHVTSRLGEPFEAWIDLKAVTIDSGDASRCISAQPGSGDSAFSGSDLRVEVDSRANGNAVLRLRSRGMMTEPVGVLAISTRCDSLGSLAREYTVLFDPPMLAASPAPAAVATSPAPVAAPTPQPVLPREWQGDGSTSVTSLAHSYYENHPRLQRRFQRYVQRLNPGLSDLSAPVPSDTTLKLPSQRMMRRPAGLRPATQTASAEAPKPKPTQQAAAESQPVKVAPAKPKPRLQVTVENAPGGNVSNTSLATAPAAADEPAAWGKFRTMPVDEQRNYVAKLETLIQAQDAALANLTKQVETLTHEYEQLRKQHDAFAVPAPIPAPPPAANRETVWLWAALALALTGLGTTLFTLQRWRQTSTKTRSPLGIE